jgi:hypothetical protein
MTKSPLHDVSPRPLFAAWFENLAVAEEHPDRVYFVVEATLRNAQMSAHHEVEESGPEVGLPAKRVMTSPVQAYVPEAELEAKEKEIRRLLVEIASLATRRGELDQEIMELRALAECVARYSEDAQMKLEAEKAIARTNALRDRASSGPLAPDPNAPRAEDIVLLHPLGQNLSPREQLRACVRGNLLPITDDRADEPLARVADLTAVMTGQVSIEEACLARAHGSLKTFAKWQHHLETRNGLTFVRPDSPEEETP